MICPPSSHSGPCPDSMASQRSCLWKSAFLPDSTWASSQTKLALPCLVFQNHLINFDRPSSVTKRKVWTPKPSMCRYDRGIPLPAIAQKRVCKELGCWLKKSHAESRSEER